MIRGLMKNFDCSISSSGLFSIDLMQVRCYGPGVAKYRQSSTALMPHIDIPEGGLRDRRPSETINH